MKINRKVWVALCITAMILILCVSSFAWYSASTTTTTQVMMQAYDNYVFEIEEISLLSPSEILNATVGFNNNQANGANVVLANLYNTPSGEINFASLKVDYSLRNNTSGGDIKMSFQVTGIRVFKEVTTTYAITPDAVPATGTIVYDGNTYYYSGATVYNDAAMTVDDEVATLVVGVDEGGTSKLYEEDNSYEPYLEPLLMFQFYQTDAASTPIYTDLALTDAKNNVDSDGWADVVDAPTGYIRTNSASSLNLAVAFNVVDDLIDESYRGLKIKVEVRMTDLGEA